MAVANATTNPQIARLLEARAWARYTNIARLAGFAGVLGAPFSLWALFWTSPRDYPFLSSMFWVPVVIYVCVLMFSRTWRRDRFVKLLFGSGIAARLAGAGAFVWTGFYTFHSVVDGFHYWTIGYQRMDQFSALGWAAFPPPYTSTNLMINLCGIIMLVTGNALPTLSVIFAFAALWGGYFFYRAFCIVFPDGNRGLYGLLVVLLPSILFWSSAIGKDALAQLFIGISAYGFAKVVTQLKSSAILIAIIGLAGTAIVRPHVGALLAVSMLVPFAMGRMKGGWMSVSAKILLVPLLAAGTLYMVKQAEEFVGMRSADFATVRETFDRESRNNRYGGSSVTAGESLSTRLAGAPLLIFRPFPWEANSAMASRSQHWKGWHSLSSPFACAGRCGLYCAGGAKPILDFSCCLRWSSRSFSPPDPATWAA